MSQYIMLNFNIALRTKRTRDFALWYRFHGINIILVIQYVSFKEQTM